MDPLQSPVTLKIERKKGPHEAALLFIGEWFLGRCQARDGDA